MTILGTFATVCETCLLEASDGLPQSASLLRNDKVEVLSRCSLRPTANPCVPFNDN